jgi:hypothetical protein
MDVFDFVADSSRGINKANGGTRRRGEKRGTRERKKERKRPHWFFKPKSNDEPSTSTPKLHHVFFYFFVFVYKFNFDFFIPIWSFNFN